MAENLQILIKSYLSITDSRMMAGLSMELGKLCESLALFMIIRLGYLQFRNA
jgi:hypothetical protein